MKLGILADVHEHARELRKAIDILHQNGADRFVVLGDVVETGKRIEKTVRLLQEVGAVGVWGNHDVGLCFDPSDKVCERYSRAVLDFMGSLQPHLEIDGCLFTHVEPWLDPHKVEDLWYFDGPPDTPAKLARSFAAVSNRVVFLGHFHRWLLGTPEGLLPWRGDGPVRLDEQVRHLVVVHAVWDGNCALFDKLQAEEGEEREVWRRCPHDSLRKEGILPNNPITASLNCSSNVVGSILQRKASCIKCPSSG